MLQRGILIAMILLVVPSLFADDATEAPRPIPLRLRLAQMRGSRSTVNAARLLNGQAPRPSRIRVEEPVVAAVIPEVPKVVKRSTPFASCEILFERASFNWDELGATMPLHQGPLPYYDEVLKYNSSENPPTITWNQGAIRHVLSLGDLARYEAYAIMRKQIVKVTARSHYDLFIGELNRVMHIDPSVSDAVNGLSIPKSNQTNLLIPTRTMTTQPNDKASEARYTAYKLAAANRQIPDPFTQESIHLAAPGRIVWVYAGIRHELSLRQTDPRFLRGQYDAFARTPTGIQLVTSKDGYALFMAELRAAMLINPEIKSALEFAGVIVR